MSSPAKRGRGSRSKSMAMSAAGRYFRMSSVEEWLIRRRTRDRRRTGPRSATHQALASRKASNDERTQTVSTLLYQVLFRDGKLGLGSAYACLVLVLVMALATVFTRYLAALQRRGA